jgi:anhydro-N-acetylmuramic acid kinase
MNSSRKQRALLVAGLMSGTSADAIDVALVRIAGSGWKLKVEPVSFSSLPWRARERAAILAACNAESISVADLSRLNVWLGEKFGEAVKAACAKAGIALDALDLVASHGQTIYHQGQPQPFLGRRIAATLQLGEAASIAEITGVDTVADFRVADVAAGGQGAPLVPFLDYLLLRHPRQDRVALNIGGIANLSLIPAGAAAGDVIAYDTGPGNMVIDALTQELSGGKLRYDRNGAWAARGAVIEPLLKQLLRDPFYRRRPPKSAGREQYGREFVADLRRRAGDARPEDLLATATALTARTIALALNRGEAAQHEWDVIASGGGVHNQTLLGMLADAAPNCRIRRSDDLGLPGDAKEAIAFAVLGYVFLHGEAGNLPRVTGARRPMVLGKLARGWRR